MTNEPATHPETRHVAASVLVVLAVLLGAAACTEDAEHPAAPGAAAAAPSEALGALAVFACTADARAGTLGCAPPASGAGLPAGASGLIVGGQATYVTLSSTNMCYEDGCTGGTAGDEIFRADVVVQNLIPQPLGTTDGTTLDAAGVRVVFHTGPVATGGTGAVGVRNADGNAVYTSGTPQPYFQYDAVLGQGEASAAKTWQWDVPATVTTFDFTVFVVADVPFPDGWIEFDADSAVAFRGNVEPLPASAYDVVGRVVDTATVAWSSSDGTVGTVDAAGVFTADADGATDIVATWRGLADTLAVEVTHLTAVATGHRHSCAIAANAHTYCWGQSFFGQLGNGGSGGAEEPRPVEVVGDHEFTQLTAGRGHTCGLEADGQTYCWGDNANGQLGHSGFGTDSDVPLPVDQSADPDMSFGTIVSGSLHTCGLTDISSEVFCWGDNNSGQLGDGNGGSSSGASDTPVKAAGTLTFDWLASGGNHVCAVTSADETYCWGSNNHGQLGIGSIGGFRDTAVAVIDTIAGLSGFGAVNATAYSTCASRSAQIYCWGYNFYGQLGNGTSGTDSSVPVAVDQTVDGGILLGFLPAGDGFHTCATAISGLYCWGQNQDGQLGNGAAGFNEMSAVPVAVDQTADGGFDVVGATGGIDLGLAHTCALATDGRVYCWGSNERGQVGDGTTTRRTRPTPIVNPVPRPAP